MEPPNRRTIILATTAYSADFNREACLQAGMDAFIAKPFTPEKIAAALRDLRGSLRAAASVVVGAPPGNAPAPAGIDLQMLRFVADDSSDGLSTQIERYLTSFHEDVQALVNALPQGEPKEIHRLAHRLISHATMVKYEPLVRLASQLQAQAASADRPALARLLADYEREWIRFRNTLESIRVSQAPV